MSAPSLSTLSSQLAAAVETAAASVVAIHARKRIPSSGIVWRDGVIVSASHTVKREEAITVTLASGETVPASIVGRDLATDLIALRLGSGPQPRVAIRSEGGAPVGSLVLAVGRPGRAATASFGIVSAVGEGWRTWQGARIDHVLRLDLAVYDGFSGGPLVDPDGRVVGLNNSALARGTPVALPASAVDRVLDELLARGHVRRPFIGVAIQPVAITAAQRERHRLAQESALLIMSVADGSPAERADLFVGDALVAASGQPLARPTDLLDALSGVPAGAAVALTFLRGGALQSASVTPVDRDGSE